MKVWTKGALKAAMTHIQTNHETLLLSVGGAYKTSLRLHCFWNGNCDKHKDGLGNLSNKVLSTMVGFVAALCSCLVMLSFSLTLTQQSLIVLHCHSSQVSGVKTQLQALRCLSAFRCLINRPSAASMMVRPDKHRWKSLRRQDASSRWPGRVVGYRQKTEWLEDVKSGWCLKGRTCTIVNQQ